MIFHKPNKSWIQRKCNSVTLLTNDMSKYVEICLLSNKTEFGIFKITSICDLVSEEEITKKKQLYNKQKPYAQEAFTFW